MLALLVVMSSVIMAQAKTTAIDADGTKSGSLNLELGKPKSTIT
jgi:hypothetical protein